MPKSLEHYQQESGRAGRDGLEAECHLFFSGADYSTWKRILEGSEPQMLETGAAKLGQMYRYCAGVACRHRAILDYFNQIPDKENCGACDICLSEVQGVPDATILSQKILSSIIRQGERFGAAYSAGVLTASQEDRILAAGIKGRSGNCPKESDDPCIQGFMVAEVDPESLENRILYDNNGKALINGVSVATQAGDAIYVGSFQGDRLIKLPR